MSSASEPMGGGVAKLPLRETIKLSYSSYFNNFGDVLRISWLWLALVVPLMGAASWLQLSWMAGAMANLKRSGPLPPDAPPMPPLPVVTMLLGGAAPIAVLLATLSIAVAWHRRMILDECPGVSGSNLMSGNVWRYAGAAMAVGLLALLPIGVIALPMFLVMGFVSPGVAQAPMPPQVPVLAAALFIGYIAAIAIGLRLILLLPARAAGDMALTFRQAWERTRGNTWRLLWGTVATTVPLGIVGVAVIAAVLGFPNADLMKLDGPAFKSYAERMAVANVVMAAFFLLILPIGIGFLSHAYRHFFPQA